MRLLITGFLALIIFIQMSAMKVKIEANKFIKNETEQIKFSESAFMRGYIDNIGRELEMLPFEWQHMQNWVQAERADVSIPMRINF